MLEIYIEPRRTSNLKHAVIEAIAIGQYDTIQDDLRDVFTDDQIAEVEELLDSNDIDEAIDDIVNDWNGDTLDELIESVESYFADSNIEIHFDHDDDLDDDEDDLEDDSGLDDFDSDDDADSEVVSEDEAGEEDEDEHDEDDEDDEDDF